MTKVNRLLLAITAPLLVATLVGLVGLWPGDTARSADGGLGPAAELVDADVTAVTTGPCRGQTPEQSTLCDSALITITSGTDAGTDYVLDLFRGPGQPRLEPGDPIVVGRVDDGGSVDYYFSDYQREAPLLWLAILFAVVVVAVGRLRGFSALAGLVVSFGLLVRFVLPAILEGSSPLLVAVVGASAIMFVLLYLAHGLSAKSTTALLGTLASLALTGLLASAFLTATRVTNVSTEEIAYLQISASQVNVSGLLLAGVIIGSLGVLNDVTVTQASSVWALRRANPSAGAVDLYRSAMTIGRDHIASTVDTLVLAYAGASIPLLLLFSLADRPLGDVLTGGLVAQEIVRALVGGIGIVASVPITTGLAAYVASRESEAPAVDVSTGTVTEPGVDLDGEAGRDDGGVAQ